MKPVLQALVLAERVYREVTGKMIIVGTFNAIGLVKPKEQEVIEDDQGKKYVMVKGGQPGSPYAYISLTDVCNGTEVSLQFVSLTRNRVIFDTTIPVTSNNRLATVEIVAALPHLIVPEAGAYALELVCEGDILGSLRIVASETDG